MTIADAAGEAGGAWRRECRLPGLSAWGRVRDWRMSQIGKMTNVNVYLESPMTAAQVAEFGADHVVLATGAKWRADGIGRYLLKPLEIAADAQVFTPDDLLDGNLPQSESVVIFDDDHYYMGGVLAELLVKHGRKVTLVTPSALASSYTRASLEQSRIQSRLLERGVVIVANRTFAQVASDHVVTSCVFSGDQQKHECGAVVLVTMRLPVAGLAGDLGAIGAAFRLIGDAWAPATIAHAVHAGRRYAEELGQPAPGPDELPYRREVMGLSVT